MSLQYKFMNRLSKLYNLLEDDLSKKLFWARMHYDVAPSIESAIEFYRLTAKLNKAELDKQYQWKSMFQQIIKKGGEIFLYGAGTVGRGLAELILDAGGEFSGFCDRNAEAYPKGLLGKTVYPPQYIFENMDDTYIVISTINYYKEIFDFLTKHRVKDDHILPFLGNYSFPETVQKQYFEFPDLFEKGTAFIDGGSYNCADSLYFAQWCAGKYSKIFAFEPDLINFEQCQKNSEQISNIELYCVGLGSQSSTAVFAAVGGTESYILDSSALNNRNFDYVDLSKASTEEIQIERLDNIVKETKIGFIKLDIEGEEYNALLGAEKMLLRDKPLLAICLYHRQGDMLAIMDYLHEMIPEYHFCIRHYSTLSYDTILYASMRPFPV